MNTILRGCCVGALILVSASQAAEPTTGLDLTRAVPADAHMVIHGRHNPERDFQRVYAENIIQTFKDEQLLERIVKIFASRVPEQQMEEANAVIDELRAAVEPIDWEALCDAQEAVYFQLMEMPANQQSFLVRLAPADAEAYKAAIENVFTMIDERAGDHVTVHTEAKGDASRTTLRVAAKEFPWQPTVATVDDVLLISSSEAIAARSLAMLLGSGEPSKFDDPRLIEVTAQLPEPEDVMVFVDGQQLFKGIRGIGDFIKRESNNEPGAVHFATLMEQVIDEFAVFDYEMTSEYTDGHRNRATAIGRLTPGFEETLVGQMFGSGEPFTDWERRIPADATAYSLNTGVNLHPLYEWAREFVSANIPEAQEALDRFDEMQQQLDIDLDRDILQAFSGETISITLPPAEGSSGAETVLALRCHQPESIRELLHRGVKALEQIPPAAAQQVKLVERSEDDDLAGFDDLSAAALTMVGARPVIGFRDGWMVIASSPEAATSVLATWSGYGPTIVESESYQRFGLTIEGPVLSLSYTDLAAQTKEFANGIRQAAGAAPMIIGAVGAKVGPEAVEPLLEIFALLPSIANVVEQFDYLEARLNVVQPGDTPETYVRETVTLVRPPDAE